MAATVTTTADNGPGSLFRRTIKQLDSILVERDRGTNVALGVGQPADNVTGVLFHQSQFARKKIQTPNLRVRKVFESASIHFDALNKDGIRPPRH